MPQEKCQYCWGRGYIYRGQFSREAKCPRCAGRGKVVTKKKR